MRVLLVSGSAPPMRCGVGDYTHRLAWALADAGVTVGLLTSPEATLGDRSGTKYERLTPAVDWSTAPRAEVMRTIRAWRPDIVHLQYPTQRYGEAVRPSLVPLMARCGGAARVRTWHEGFTKRTAGKFLLQWAAGGRSITVRPDLTSHLWRALRPLVRLRPPILITGASSIPPSTLSDEERNLLRARLLGGQRKLLVNFGFLYPDKGVEALFKLGRPERDAIRIAGPMHVDGRYTAELQALAASPEWRGQASLLGFLSESDTADLLRAADVVVLPFRKGGGSWNSSIHAAALQGTPVVTTSAERSGRDASRNIWFVPPGDADAMQAAVDEAMSVRDRPPAGWLGDDWARIAREHLAVYQGGLR